MWHYKCQGDRISAKTLASRHGLPPQHLESVLQALARDGMAARRLRIGARTPRPPTNILHAADRVEDTDERPAASELVNKVVLPALAGAEHEFGVALGRINLDDMARDAGTLGVFLRADLRR